MKPGALLPPAVVLLLALGAGGPAAAQPFWIDHASRPGPDRASLGVSRFDELFHDPATGYRIPYPFAALADALAARVDNGAHSGVRRAIIPHGRSLQRDAAVPDHFRLPRVVIALEGEPSPIAGDPGRVLEYRLFIAHQPATQSLEIISYNDAAGRFEFQVVDDYAAGKRPRVRPANRAMCLSCHHNAAPIFPRNPWSETNANVAVANRLLAASPERYGSLIGLVSNDAGVIDVLSERANYLSAAQFFWREGCASAARCRAALLRAVLQYRLAAETSFDWHDPRFDADFARELERRFVRRWPQGVALAGSRIPDRDPLAGDQRRAHDPLMPRPPQARWQQVEPVLTRGLVYRLAGFFTQADIRRIDAALRAGYGRHPRQRHTARCRVAEIADGVARLNCGDPAIAGRLRARLEVDLGGGAAPPVRVQALQVPGDLNLWQPTVVAAQRVAAGLSIELGAAGDLSLRLADGSRVSRFELGWRGDLGSDESTLELELSREFADLDAALGEMLASHRRGQASSLARGPFERRRLLDELLPALGVAAPRWPSAPRPEAPVAAPTEPLSGTLALLEPHCGGCHRTPGLNPPGFLVGPAAPARIRQCAPRMLARLYAWQPESVLPAAPMPPPASLADGGARWRNSDHYRELLALLEPMVAPPLRAAIRAGRDSAGLPACRFGD